jgi:hypothetical protein
MEHLSTLPRGNGPLGFYEIRREQMVPVVSVRVAADLPQAERSELELLRTDTPTFAAFVEARRTRARAGSSTRWARSSCATCRCRCAHARRAER